jgi:hypothetical protein
MRAESILQVEATRFVAPQHQVPVEVVRHHLTGLHLIDQATWNQPNGTGRDRAQSSQSSSASTRTALSRKNLGQTSS